MRVLLANQNRGNILNFLFPLSQGFFWANYEKKDESSLENQDVIPVAFIQFERAGSN